MQGMQEAMEQAGIKPSNFAATQHDPIDPITPREAAPAIDDEPIPETVSHESVNVHGHQEHHAAAANDSEPSSDEGDGAAEPIPATVTHDNAPVNARKNNGGHNGNGSRRNPDNRGDRRTTPANQAHPRDKGKKSKPRAPLAIGMATVERGNRQGEIVFRGLLVPGIGQDGTARARVIAPNRDCPQWFLDECRTIADNFDGKQVRIRVSHTIANGISFATPAADSLEQLNQEWERQQRDLDSFPKTLDACPGLATGLELIYREAVKVYSTNNDKLELLKLVIRSQADGGSYAVMGMKRNGQLFRFTNAENVWAAREQVLSGEITLARAMRTHMTSQKILDPQEATALSTAN